MPPDGCEVNVIDWPLSIAVLEDSNASAIVTQGSLADNVKPTA